MTIQLPLVFFTLFAGAAGGAMVFLCLAELFGLGRRVTRVTCYVIVALFVVGGLSSVMHLAQKLHIMSVVTNLGSFSGISMELIGLSISFALVALYWLLTRERQSDKARRIVGILCGIMGVIFCWIQGSSYVIPARPHWDSLLLPIGYWASGLAVGAMVFMAVLAFLKVDRDGIRRFIPFGVGLVALQLVCYLAYNVWCGPDALIVNAALVWGAEIVVGSLGPVACLLLVWSGKDARLLYVALVCALVGGIAFRVMMWTLGAGYFPGLFDVAAQSRGWIGW